MQEKIKIDIKNALSELLLTANFEENSLLVIGCSTSEVIGKKIGSAGSEEVASAIFDTAQEFCREKELNLACQCCEHLNRSLVVEKKYAKAERLTIVNAVPQIHAGGSFATYAYKHMEEPCLVDSVSADMGIDIGNTLIGMHIRPVCVPVRVSICKIGEANLTLARSRCKYVGGERAIYDPKLS